MLCHALHTRFTATQVSRALLAQLRFKQRHPPPLKPLRKGAIDLRSQIRRQRLEPLPLVTSRGFRNREEHIRRVRLPRSIVTDEAEGGPLRVVELAAGEGASAAEDVAYEEGGLGEGEAHLTRGIKG